VDYDPQRIAVIDRDFKKVISSTERCELLDYS
jgi:hypothetical protein